MSERFDLNFPCANQAPKIPGVIKQRVEDFYVEECLEVTCEGQGEHVWLWLEKSGQNTEFVANKIASFAQVRKMDVGLSGLKDRWAVTRQWFSVYLGNKPEPNWNEFDCEGVTILSHQRHVKKLRRGEHSANKFRILVTGLPAEAKLDAALGEIQVRGFPNYYGPQRFGVDGANLDRGDKFFSGKIKASKSQRSFYLSAARSYLFNLNLAELVCQDKWLDDTLGGPLYGDERPGHDELNDAEKAILEAYPAFAQGIHKNRLSLERRPYAIVPADMAWRHQENECELEFVLPTGVFATSLLAEVFDLSQGLGAGNDALRSVT